MIVIVDASVAVKWYAREDGTDDANLLLDARLDGLELRVPDIFLAETLNALLRKVRIGQMTDAQLDAAQEHLRMLDLPTIASKPVLGRAVRLSRRLDHAIYDCLYLACAERESATLVTADRHFARKHDGAETRIVTLDGVRSLVSNGSAAPP